MQQLVPQGAAETAGAELTAALEKRVRSLEEQLIDLRTMIGTVQSMRPAAADAGANPGGYDRAASGEAAASWQASPENGEAGDARFEMLSQQLQTLSLRLSRLEGGNAAPADGSAAELAPAAVQDVQRSEGLTEPQPSPEAADEGAAVEPAPVAPKSPVFNGGGSFSGSNGLGAAREAAAPQSEPQAPGGDAEALYKQAYGHMLARDYASAETAFKLVIAQHPQAEMAGSSHYWLGETYYVRGEYRAAADAFLKSYRNYPNSVKAPDSLMKLAFTLARLGERDAACRTFGELDTKYPNAPDHVRQRATQEQRRVGCK